MLRSTLLTLFFTLISSVEAQVPCSAIKNITVPGANILSIIGTEIKNFTSAASQTSGHIYPAYENLSFCNVSIVLTHPGANDTVVVGVWLPAHNWNGRFQATGGGGYSVGFESSLGPAVGNDYAAAFTDGGNIGYSFNLLPQALLPNGQVNLPLLENYASRSLHEMAVIGKAVIVEYYGQNPEYSYWNGCSGGGRQGYMEAQNYPEDFDGIMAASPAIYFGKSLPSLQWPYVVMQEEKTVPSQCVLQAFIDASIELCDGLDGVTDGIISNLEDCHFSPYSIVGNHVKCDGTTHKITSAEARVYRKILDGPTSPHGEKLWFGWTIGTGFDGLFNGNVLVTTTNGKSTAAPQILSDQFIKYLLKHDPNYNTSGITYSEFADLFTQSISQYDAIAGTNNPDLSAFKKAGGKLLSWQGLTDNILFPQALLKYRQEVDKFLGGWGEVNEFYRLFFAPGVNHCGGGYGPWPNDPLAALVEWVEKGTVPETLRGSYTNKDGDVVTSDICSYPLVSRYIGGDPKVAGSYKCATSFGVYV